MRNRRSSAGGCWLNTAADSSAFGQIDKSEQPGEQEGDGDNNSRNHGGEVYTSGLPACKLELGSSGRLHFFPNPCCNPSGCG